MRDPYEALLRSPSGAVPGTCLLAALNTLGVGAPPVVAGHRNLTTAHEHDGVTEVWPSPGDAGRDLDTGGQAHTSDLTKSGVGFLRSWCTRVHARSADWP